MSQEPDNDGQLRTIFQKFGDIVSKNALDVATGDGNFIKALTKILKSYNTFTGVDIDQKALNKAFKTFKTHSFNFLSMNAGNMGFQDESFDLVSTSESLHHLKDPIKVLKEIRRILNKKGNFILHESFSDSNQSKAQLSDVKIHRFLSRNDILRGKYHHGFYLQKEILSMLEMVGFQCIESYVSKKPVKCALCKYIEKCTDTKSNKMINIGLRSIETSLKSIKSFNEYNDIKDQVNHIKNYIQENGYAPASVIVIFAKK
ncbi:MAG: class I SAM-dependent methyltransferase [Candidatus Heimdallarchaeota archaeon]|nr:class I SAM-dependent methyltransferase [Candidatus Heimdallarchaeota archaeon]